MSKPLNKNLLALARNLGVVFVLCVPLSLLFLGMGYDRGLIIAFSIANLLVWTDGFLTFFALKMGATEINPFIAILNRLVGKKRCLFASRIVGSMFCVFGLMEKNQSVLLAIAWIMSIVICINSVTLLSKSEINIGTNKANNSDKQCPCTKIKRPNIRSDYRNYSDKDSHDKEKNNKITHLTPSVLHSCHLQYGAVNSSINTRVFSGLNSLVDEK